MKGSRLAREADARARPPRREKQCKQEPPDGREPGFRKNAACECSMGQRGAGNFELRAVCLAATAPDEKSPGHVSAQASGGKNTAIKLSRPSPRTRQ